MNKAEKLLNSLATPKHMHDVCDTDVLFEIDPFDKTITSTGGQKSILVQDDHNSEIFTFKIPRYIEGHDMLLCDLVRIPYINSEVDTRNPRFATGVYTSTDLKVYEKDPDYLTFSWKISKNATVYPGTLAFMVVMLCMDGIHVLYRFGTDAYEDVYVLEKIDAELSFENEYVDIIEQWKEAVKAEFTDYINVSTQTHADNIEARLTAYIDANFTNIKSDLQRNIDAFDTILENEITNMDNEINVLKSRMNTFANLPEGSTAGDAELADIRVDSNGVIHENAGDAVRSQFEQTRDEMRHTYVHTDNLVNRHLLVKGLLNGNNGEVLYGTSDYDEFITTNFINVTSGSTYDVRVPEANGFNRVLLYTDPNTVHSHVAINTPNTEATIEIPEGVTLIRMSFHCSTAAASVLALVSVVKTGNDINSPMLGRISYESLEHQHKVTESGKMSVNAIASFKNMSNNMFNKYETTDNYFLDKLLDVRNDDIFGKYFISHYIPVIGGETYTLSPIWSVLYFNGEYECIGFSNDANNTSITVTVPDGTSYIRFNALMSNKDVVMMNQGATLLPYEPFIGEFGFVHDLKHKHLYTLREAMSNWYAGEKFPIGFFGDSTTDGMGTTSGGGHQTQDSNAGGWGKADYLNHYAYPYLLENLLREATGNDRLRVYNIGYSGERFKTIMKYYDNIFGNVYSDVKMVGIVFGINDRLTTNQKAYYNEFRENLIYTVEYLLRKNIQPFMVTTQATLEPYCEDTIDDTYYPMRDSESINTIANGIKREIAAEYGLEVLDMNSYGEFMINYSQIPVDDITTDHIHFKNAGHKFESEYLYSYICGRCVNVKRGDLLTFASQKMRSKCPSNYVKSRKSDDGFKVCLDYKRDDTEDIVVQDFVIHVDEKAPVELVAYCDTPTTQYVVLDGVTYQIKDDISVITNALDVGVHRLVVKSGNSTDVNWIGFKVE